MNNTRVGTIHIYPGPIYDIESIYTAKYEAFSEFSEGALVSTSNYTGSHRFGNFDAFLARPKPRNSATLFLSLLKNAFVKAYKIKNLGVVVSYDPIKTGIIGVLLKFCFRCKLIVEVNGTYADDNLYENNGLVDKLKRKIYWWIQVRVLNSADGIKCLYEGQVSSFPIKDTGKIKVFLNYTNIPTSEYRDIDSKTLLSIGFPPYIKGFDLLIEAFLRLNAEFPEWKLILLGYFDPVSLQKTNMQIGDNKNISIEKPVPFSEVPKFIDKCEIFVLASRSEGVPRVLLEAAARGKARIGSDAGGIPKILNDGYDGYIFKKMDVDDLTEKMRILMKSKEERIRLSKNALERFQNEFTLKTYIDNYKSFYQFVLKNQ